jgi:cytochrome P450
MAELMANPMVMEKAQSEIRRILKGQKRVHEVALRELSYLKAVIKETLRLHPPIPLIPRVSVEDRKVQGYNVPKGTIIVANAWAISRDPKNWEDPNKFMPERFEVKDSFNFTGLDFEFIPFGAGRRICPAISFAQANIEIALASLIYHFDWKLPTGVKPEELDMTASCGLEVRRKADLLLHPISRVPSIDE